MADGSGVEPQRSRCPICRKFTEVEYRPFCSKRCADIDLGRWLNGGYSIPTFEEPGPDQLSELGDDNEDPA